MLPFLVSLLIFVYGKFIKPLIVLFFTFYHRKINKLKPLKPVKDPLLLLPAHQLAKKIRSKEVTCQHVIEAYIDRIKEVNPLINSAVVTCFDEALEEARNVDYVLSCDQLPEGYSEEEKPLLGVPFSCKESHFVKGKPNSAGHLARKDSLSPEDSNAVRNMRQAGAILTCLTNTSEFCMWIESRNLVYGISRNPYNLSRIVGGSTGGEGAILSACGSIIGIGSDIGGSIRMPAFFNGIYGFKSTPGLINTRKSYPSTPADKVMKINLLSTGPMCRYASDLRLLVKIQAEKDLYAPLAQKFESKTNMKKLKYFVLTDFGGSPIISDQSKSCQEALNKAIKFIETSLNVEVKSIKLNNIKYIFQMWSALMANGETETDNFLKLIKENSSQPINIYVELFKSAFGLSNLSFNLILNALFEKLPKKDPKKFIEMRNDMFKELSDILGEDGILLSPGFPVVAPMHSQPILTNIFDFIYFGIWNALAMPVTQCPMGLCESSGLPVGVQVVANSNCDHLTISLAEYFENNLIGWTPPF